MSLAWRLSGNVSNQRARCACLPCRRAGPVCRRIGCEGTLRNTVCVGRRMSRAADSFAHSAAFDVSWRHT